MVSPAEIDPFQLWQIAAELFLYRRQRFRQRVSILLTERMEMQSADAFQLFRLEFRQPDAQPGIR